MEDVPVFPLLDRCDLSRMSGLRDPATQGSLAADLQRVRQEGVEGCGSPRGHGEKRPVETLYSRRLRLIRPASTFDGP